MESPSSWRRFSSELKRRIVYQVAVAYLVAVWLPLHVIDYVVVVDPVPSWLYVAVTMLMLLGFPAILIVAWRRHTDSREH